MFLLFLFCKVFLIFKADYLAYFIITIYFKWPHKYIQYTVICRTAWFCKLLLLHSGLIYRHRKTAKTDFVLLCWFQSYSKFKLVHSRAESDYVSRKLHFFDNKGLANTKFICIWKDAHAGMKFYTQQKLHNKKIRNRTEIKANNFKCKTLYNFLHNMRVEQNFYTLLIEQLM